MFKKLFIIFLFSTIAINLNAQALRTFTLIDQKLDKKYIPELNRQLSEYYIIDIPTNQIYQYLSDGDVHEITLTFYDIIFNIKIWENDLISDNATVRTSDGLKYGKAQFGVKTFDLISSNGERGALTIGRNYICGMIGSFCIQPLHEIVGGSSINQYVLFNEFKVNDYIHLVCTQENSIVANNKVETRSTQCFKGDVDIADDYNMYQQQGYSITNVQNWNISKLNTTQSRFDNEFSNPIQYSLDEQFIVTTAASEPWPLNISINQLLTEFATWGEGTGNYAKPGFETSPNQATLWTNRSNIAGPFGIAYTGEFCSYYGYNITKQVSTLSDKLQTHEMGHGMDMNHVNPGNSIYYMNATLSSAAAQWKTDNTNEIQSYLASNPCNQTELYCPALPIELHKLEIADDNCKDIIIKWTTLSEENTVYFELERAGEDLNFKTIGNVKANGTTNEAHSYNFKDYQPKEGINYYRLSSTDFDGKTTFYPIKSIDRNCKSIKYLVQNAISNYSLLINTQYNQNENFQILDTFGNVIETGNISLVINISNISAGMYYFKVNNNVEKFVVFR